MLVLLQQRFFIILSVVLISACGGSSGDSNNPPAPVPPTEPPVTPSQPTIDSLAINNATIGRFEKLQMAIDLTAEHTNPFDQNDIALNATFTSPTNDTYAVAGFWDNQLGWLVRFAPSATGQWNYAITVTNKNGTSNPTNGSFNVTSSNKSGWIQAANKINPDYSPHYFLHQDGSEFYGIGHGDVFSIFRDSDTTQRLLTRLKAANENYFVWWPQFYFSLVNQSHLRYSQANIELIDDVIELTEQQNLKLVFTIWDHSQLRDSSHSWSDGRWDRNNGFSQLTSATDFFTDSEAWQSQQNLYRYIIARWGYSSAIAMWQTVSEINGTNAFESADSWHQRINDYFVQHDPYRHPTTASQSGDLTWPQGNAVMDVPQVHIYRDLLTDSNDPLSPAKTIESAEIIANYTQEMWQSQAKPNWIGEFGVINNVTDQSRNYYPEVFHNALWSALAAGAAMTPAEWNDFSDWGQITASMQTTLQNFSKFVDELSLAQWAPTTITINTPLDIKAWGIAGQQGGLIWLQDITLAGKTISEIRSQQTPYPQLTIEVEGLATGSYDITPYNTHSGQFLSTISIDCLNDSPCLIQLDSFERDIALKIMAR